MRSLSLFFVIVVIVVVGGMQLTHFSSSIPHTPRADDHILRVRESEDGARKKQKNISKPDKSVASPVAHAPSGLLGHIHSVCERRELVYDSEAKSKELGYGWRKEVSKDIRMDYIIVPPVGSMKGTMVFFHGCGHAATDFCFQTKKCPKCHPLPEELKYALQALQHGLQIIVITSSNKASHCWKQSSYLKVSKDGKEELNNLDLVNIIHVLRHEHVIEPRSSLPIIAMGASSGGSFVKFLPGVIGSQLIGVIAQIAAPDMRKELKERKSKSPFTVIYSVMGKDKHTTSGAKAAVKAIIKKGILGVYANFSVLASHSIGPGFFFDRIPFSMNQYLSQQIWSALTSEHHLDKAGFLTKDPRTSDWRSALANLNQERDSLKADKSPIAEEMNVAYSFHEFCADDASINLDTILANAAESPH